MLRDRSAPTWTCACDTAANRYRSFNHELSGWLTTSLSSAMACSFVTGFFRPRPSSGLYVQGGTKWLRLRRHETHVTHGHCLRAPSQTRRTQQTASDEPYDCFWECAHSLASSAVLMQFGDAGHRPAGRRCVMRHNKSISVRALIATRSDDEVRG